MTTNEMVKRIERRRAEFSAHMDMRIATKQREIEATDTWLKKGVTYVQAPYARNPSVRRATWSVRGDRESVFNALESRGAIVIRAERADTLYIVGCPNQAHTSEDSMLDESFGD